MELSVLVQLVPPGVDDGVEEAVRMRLGERSRHEGRCLYN